MMNFLKTIRGPEAPEDPAVVLRMNAIADRGRAEACCYPRLDELPEHQPAKQRFKSSELFESGLGKTWDERS